METKTKIIKGAKISLIGLFLMIFGCAELFAQVNDELPKDVTLPFKENVGFAYLDSVYVPSMSADTLNQNAVYFLTEVAGDDEFEELEPGRRIHDVIWLNFEAPHTESAIEMNFDLALEIQEQRYLYHVGNIRIHEVHGSLDTFTPLEEVLNPDLEVVNEPAYARDMAVAVDRTIRDFLENLHHAMLHGNVRDYDRQYTWYFRPPTK